MKCKRLGMLLFLIMLFLLVACKGENNNEIVEEPNEANNQIENEEDIEPEVPEEPEEPKEKYPLTGLEVDDDEVDFNYRPIGVMIENSSSARPQSGLHQADVVYEILSEGSITRFLAFFHSQQPERIGPVRSARTYYVQLSKGYDSVYVSAGGSPGGLRLAQSEVDGVSGLTYDGRFFYRSSDRRAPHNLYTSYEGLLGAIDHRGYDMSWEPEGLFFENELGDVLGDEALKIDIYYGSGTNNVQYVYDEQMKKYRRYNGGVASHDLDTGEAIAPKNIFIVEAFHRVIPAGENHIDAGENRREIDIQSGGRAYLIQEGIAQHVEWENRDGRIVPVKDGKLVPLLPGQTWINFVPSSDNGLDSKVIIYNE